MPMLISTPEDYFREKQEDFFEFEYCGKENRTAFAKHRDEMNEWWDKLFPQHQVTRLGPSEYSGWICGGPGMSTTPVNETVRKAFLEKWTFKSSPWKLVEHRYNDWLTAVRSCEVVAAPLQVRRSVRYWQLPEGPLLLGQNAAGRLLSRHDAKWWFSQDMQGHKADLRMGMVSGVYFYHPSNTAGKTDHLASIDWEDVADLEAAKKLEGSKKFKKWLRTTLAIPDNEKLEITTEL